MFLASFINCNSTEYESQFAASIGSLMSIDVFVFGLKTMLATE
nr:MAG TPA: hypothetical protein [Bacteriophage sp.]